MFFIKKQNRHVNIRWWKISFITATYQSAQIQIWWIYFCSIILIAQKTSMHCNIGMIALRLWSFLKTFVQISYSKVEGLFSFRLLSFIKRNLWVIVKILFLYSVPVRQKFTTYSPKYLTLAYFTRNNWIGNRKSPYHESPDLLFKDHRDNNYSLDRKWIWRHKDVQMVERI